MFPNPRRKRQLTCLSVKIWSAEIPLTSIGTSISAGGIGVAEGVIDGVGVTENDAPGERDGVGVVVLVLVAVPLGEEVFVGLAVRDPLTDTEAELLEEEEGDTDAVIEPVAEGDADPLELPDGDTLLDTDPDVLGLAVVETEEEIVAVADTDEVGELDPLGDEVVDTEEEGELELLTDAV